MKLTNKFGLPEAIVRAVTPREVSLNANRISVTRLIDSPQIARLTRKHWDSLEDDVSNRLWALLGQLMHTLLEEHAPDNSLAEENAHFFVDDVCISFRSDLYYNESVEDYKVTSVWSTIIGDKAADAEKQLNVYAYAFRKMGFPVKRLVARFLYRDWSQNEKSRYEEYPEIPFETIELRLWSEEEQLAYIKLRIAAHKDETALCSDKERWQRKTKWAIMKEGRKTAVRVFDSHDAAEKFFVEAGDSHGSFSTSGFHSIVERPGAYVRCESYCGVREFCPQWAKERKC